MKEEERGPEEGHGNEESTIHTNMEQLTLLNAGVRGRIQAYGAQNGAMVIHPSPYPFFRIELAAL